MFLAISGLKVLFFLFFHEDFRLVKGDVEAGNVRTCFETLRNTRPVVARLL